MKLINKKPRKSLVYKIENVACSNLLQKLKTFEDRQNFARKLGMILNIIFRIYSPKRKGVLMLNFSLAFYRGRKR